MRTGKSWIDANGRERWLIIKQRDEYADPSWDIENPRFDRSVLTAVASSRSKATTRKRYSVALLPLFDKNRHYTDLPQPSVTTYTAAPFIVREEKN